MFCSVCRDVEIVADNTKVKTCPSRHVFCEKCCEGIDGTCPVCRGAMREFDRRTLTDGLNLTTSENSLEEGPTCVPEMNALYSRGSKDLSDADLKHFLMWSTGRQEQCRRLDQMPANCNDRSTCEALGEQIEQELRLKTMDDIYRSHRANERQLRTIADAAEGHPRSVGVSTDSSPRLSLHPPTSRNSSSERIPHEEATRSQISPRPEYVLMNVSTKTTDVAKRLKTSSIDVKLQQILGAHPQPESPTTKEEQNFYRLLREKFPRLSLDKLEEIISSIDSQADAVKKTAFQTTPDECPDEPKTHLVANSRRAFSNPLTEAGAPQSQVIGLYSLSMSTDLLQTEILDGTLNIPRRPLICPISTCQREVFVSNFTKHIAIDHTDVPMQGIRPQQHKNFLLDPKLIHFGAIRCQLLLLVKNKVTNLGHDKFKDFIPVLLMTTRLSLLEICSSKHEPVKGSTQNFVMIWLTGISPPHLPIFFSLTLWARSALGPVCHLVHSGRLYSVREAQSPEAVRQSGQMMLLSSQQLDSLTNGGRNMLELQISVH